MSQSSAKIRDIFDAMDYGIVNEGQSLAEAWISEHAHEFGPFLNGKLSPATENVDSVSTGMNLNVTVKLNIQEDSARALSSAISASSKWGQLEGHARAKVLYNIARQLQKHVALLTQLEALSSGVLVRDPRENDVPALIRAFYYYAGWAQLTDSDLEKWKPLEVVAGICSSSSSLLSLAMVAAPALAAGNAVILFPTTTNFLPALLLAQIFSAAGLFPGVLNVVPLEPANISQYSILAAKEVKKVAAIGSSHLGQSALKVSTSNISQDYALLLSGCVPMIILESADLDAAVDCAIDAAWTNQGRDPWALRLVVVQEAVMEVFKKKFISRVKGLKLGGAFDKMADVSCTLLNNTTPRRLLDILEMDPSAEVVQPVTACCGQWAPTVIFCAAPPSPPVLSAVEVCPVVHVVGARSLKEAVSIANHSGAGGAASVWVENNAQAWEVASQLRVGTVWINGHSLIDASVPLCGRGISGRGCFSGKEGLLEYLQPRYSVNSSKVKTDNFAQMSSLPVSSVVSSTDVAPIDVTYKFFYGGGHKRPDSNSSVTLIDGSGQPFAVIPEANRKDIRNAVEVAVKAQPSWWKRGAHNRAQIMYNLAEKLQARHDHFSSHLQKVYQVKDSTISFKEVDESVCRLFHFAALCDKFVHCYGNSTLNNQVVTVTREPYGVVAILAATGSALLDVVTLIGAALAYGNTCIVVPRSDCPTALLEFAQILEAAEVPAGVINILSGESSALVPTICGHMEIDAVWCIGHGPEVLSKIKEESALSNLKYVWYQEHVSSPVSSARREIYEKAASHCKAIWMPNISSFGN